MEGMEGNGRNGGKWKGRREMEGIPTIGAGQLDAGGGREGAVPPFPPRQARQLEEILEV